MKKLISILLLSLYLLSTTELYQLFKVPILIEHYLEHKKLNPEMTWEAFLNTHYNSNPVKDADYSTDRKLPFIVHTTPLSLVFTINQAFTFDVENYHSKQIEHHKISSYENIFYNKGFLNSIWEPPRYS